MRHQDKQRQDKQLRQFGLTVGGIFGVIALWPLLFRADRPRLWAFAVAVALVVPALVLPGCLTYVHRGWMLTG